MPQRASRIQFCDTADCKSALPAEEICLASPLRILFCAKKILIIPTLAGLTLCPASAQSLSTSKISAHLINAYTSGSSNIIAGHPRTLKVLGLDSGFPTSQAQAMRDYKTQVPGGKAVVRIYSPKNYSLSDDPTASASDFWTTVLQQSLNTLSASNRALIDYLEGPNEGETPTLGNPNSAPLQASQWFNQFWTNLTPLIVAAGYKPCIGSIAVGNPGGTTAEMQSYLDAFVPALRQAKAAGGAWSYHAYTINYTTDVGTEYYYSLRYRQFYEYFASADPDLSAMTMILTEGGVDMVGDPSTSGWHARGSAADYQRWLNWFDQQLQQDSYILGCTLFENGDPGGWSSFDLEPIAGWLKGYLLGPAVFPSPPTSISAVPGNGVVTLSWTNAPLTPTTWSVKRSTNNGGPYFTIATNITTGVQATTYSDTSVSNFTTYYYIVTAMNALGESVPSAQVLATPTAPVPTAINCGGSALGTYLSDAYYDAGTAYSTGTAISTNGLINPAPVGVYQSQRYGNLTYTLPYLAPRTSYKVRLHFAEIYWNAANQRRFDVLLDNAPVLTNFDIHAAAGGSYKANVQEFYAVSYGNGTITVQLNTVLDNASINGIEVIGGVGTEFVPAPTNLTATVGNAAVTLVWGAPPNATGFLVKRSTNNGGPYSVIASNLTEATFRDVSFVPNTTYYYVVSATGGLGGSANSVQVSAHPTNGLPDLIVTGISWTPAGNLFAGTNVVFKATVMNQGSATWPSGTNLGVGFLVDGAQVSYEGGYVSGLAVGASVLLTANGGPSGGNWAATAGPHTILANSDDINRYPEGNENNNTLSQLFTVYARNYALNSGGGAIGSFAADANVAGSANTYSVTNGIATNGVANVAPIPVYQSERWGDFAYVLNNLVPGSNYTTRLHFAEISPSVSNAGDRKFNVSINGTQIFTSFDVLAEAGSKFRAITRDIKKRADSVGTITVQFIPGATNQPKCSGIELFGSAPTLQAPQITSCKLTNGSTLLTWQSTAATIYQVQYKTNLSDTNWLPLGNNLVATGNTLSATNNNAGAARRFFRVVQIQ